MQGLIDWVNTFQLNRNVVTSGDLADGVALAEIMTEIDPSHFANCKLEEENENWVIKSTNLERLHKLVLQHYEDNLEMPASAFPHIDFEKIAKENDEGELTKLVQMVLGCVVQCEHNQEYIEKITSLSKESQEVLMLMIQEIMSRTQESIPNRQRSLSTSSEYDNLKSQIQQLQEEKEEHEQERDELLKRLKDTEEKLENMEQEKREHEAKIEELTDTIKGLESDSHEQDLQRHIETLQDELSRERDAKGELEQQIRDQKQTIMELNRKASENAKALDEVADLKKRIEELRNIELKYEKAEGAIEKYKQKLEEANDFKKQYNSLQKEMDTLSKRNKELEDNLSKSSASKSTASTLKRDNEELKEKYDELVFMQQKLEYDCDRYREQVEDLQKENASYELKMEELRERIQELELTGGEPTEARGISNDLMQHEISELKSKIAELEKVNFHLQSSGEAPEGGSTMPSGGYSGEKELTAQLFDIKAELQKKIAEYDTLKKNSELLKAKLVRVQDDLKTKEDENKDLTTKITALQSQNLALLEQKLEDKGKETSKDSSSHGEKLEMAAQKILSIQEEKTSLRNALKKAKTYIDSQDKKIKDLTQTLEQKNQALTQALEKSQGSADKSVYDAAIREKDAEIESLRAQLKHDRESYKKEQRMMLSAWYTLGTQAKRQTASNKKLKSSFLAKERATGQLRPTNA